MQISSTDARKNFSELINRAFYGDEQITITRNGQPLVVMVSAKRLEELQAIEDEVDGKAAEEAMKENDFSESL